MAVLARGVGLIGASPRETLAGVVRVQVPGGLGVVQRQRHAALHEGPGFGGLQQRLADAGALVAWLHRQLAQAGHTGVLIKGDLALRIRCLQRDGADPARPGQCDEAVTLTDALARDVGHLVDTA